MLKNFYAVFCKEEQNIIPTNNFNYLRTVSITRGRVREFLKILEILRI